MHSLLRNEKEMGLETPLALIIFRRPDHTRRVLKAIAAVRPKVLYVISDGPVPGDLETASAVAECHSIIEAIDWDCEVKKNYSGVNLGCRDRIVSGLDWVFQNESKAIILEDDCLPEKSFFSYCEHLLEKYEKNERIAGIGGTNIFERRLEGLASDFFFSRYPAIWGWATWNRSWDEYRRELPEVSMTEMKKYIKFSPNSKTNRYWLTRFKEVREGRLDTWDYQLAFTCMENDKLWVIPKSNLIRNIGFGDGAAHTLDPNSPFADLATSSLAQPFAEPKDMNPEEKYDDSLRNEFHVNKRLRSAAIGVFRFFPKRAQNFIRAAATKHRFQGLR